MRNFALAAVLSVACAHAGQGSNPYGTSGGVGGTSTVTVDSSNTGSGSCPGGLVACGGTCVDTVADSNHCGTCGNACPTGSTCDGGTCIATTTTTSSAVSVAASSVSVSASSTGVASSSAAVTVAASSSSGGGGTCDPMFPGPGCGSGKHCQPTENGIPLCIGPTGFSGQYGFCSSSADCGPELECVNTPFSTVYCLQWCTSDADCGGIDLCATLNPPVYVGATEYGVCYDGNP